MQLTNQQKLQIAKAIETDLKMRQQSENGSYSHSNHARYLDIHPASYSRIGKGDVEKVLSDLEWVRIGKKLFVDLGDVQWKIAKTNVFKFVTAQLETCQRESLSAINCDLVGIGKTTAAEVYAASHANVIYIKCRQGITRADLMRSMAQNMGLEYGDKVSNIRERVELHLLKLSNPIVILDDAGYMNDNCWMEIKGLYDVTVYGTGWYIIGDTSLKKKIQKLLSRDKMGWKALFDRFNQTFQAITDHYDSEASVKEMLREMSSQILHLNLPGADKDTYKEIMTRAGLSLRVLRQQVTKKKGLTSKAA